MCQFSTGPLLFSALPESLEPPRAASETVIRGGAHNRLEATPRAVPESTGASNTLTVGEAAPSSTTTAGQSPDGVRRTNEMLFC
jgi:hypothetical protein